MIGMDNYEIWFIDFLDGKLSSGQEAELYTFLSLHPDLKAELDDLSVDVPLLFETLHVPDLPLKKEIKPVGNITEANYEQIFIASREGDLSSSEKLGLEEFLTINPFLVFEKSYYEKLTVSHRGERFLQKNRLKRSPLVVPLFRYAAAASVIVLLGVGIARYNLGISHQPAEMALSYTWGFPKTGYPQVEVTNVSNVMAAAQTKKHEITEAMGRSVNLPMRITGIDLQVAVPLPTHGFNANISESHFPGFSIQENGMDDDALSFRQVVGKVMESSFGESGLSDGLRKEQPITAKDMVDLAASPFKNDKQPVLSTTGDNTGGKRRIKLNLGIFEADFALH